MDGKFERGFRVLVETESALDGLLNDMAECGIEWRSSDLANQWSPRECCGFPVILEYDYNGQLCYEKV